MSWSSRKKKEGIFVPFILSEGNFFNICVLSQCAVYLNINTLYQKNITSYTFLLVFKIVERLQRILNFSADDIAKIIQNLDPNKAHHGRDQVSISVQY